MTQMTDGQFVIHVLLLNASTGEFFHFYKTMGIAVWIMRLFLFVLLNRWSNWIILRMSFLNIIDNIALI